MSPKLILAALDIAERIDWPEVIRRIKKRIKRMQALQIFTSIFTFIAFWVLATQNKNLQRAVDRYSFNYFQTNVTLLSADDIFNRAEALGLETRLRADREYAAHVKELQGELSAAYRDVTEHVRQTNAEAINEARGQLYLTGEITNVAGVYGDPNGTNQHGRGFYTFERGKPFYVTSRSVETNFEVYSNSVYHSGEQWIEYPTAPKPKREVDVQIEKQFWRLDIQWTSPEAGAWLKKEAGQFGWWRKSDYRDTSGELWVNRTYDLKEVADYIRQRPWLANPFKP